MLQTFLNLNCRNGYTEAWTGGVTEAKSKFTLNKLTLAGEARTTLKEKRSPR